MLAERMISAKRSFAPSNEYTPTQLTRTFLLSTRPNLRLNTQDNKTKLVTMVKQAQQIAQHKRNHQPGHWEDNRYLRFARDHQNLSHFIIESAAFFNVGADEQQSDLPGQQASLHFMQTEHEASRPLVLQRVLLVRALL